MDEIVIRMLAREKSLLPEYKTAGSAGADLRADLAEDLALDPMERRLVPTGLRMELPPGYEAQVRPRSGLAIEKGLTCLNSPGTIDSDYRGEIKVLLVNLGSHTAVIHPGERIAQLVIATYTRARFEVVTALSESERGEGGFGSTGA